MSIMRSLSAAFFSCSLVLAVGTSHAAAEENQSLNYVVIFVDDLGYGDLGCHGNPVLKTPHLDRLYHQSVRLADYHVAPTCSPTRAARLVPTRQ